MKPQQPAISKVLKSDSMGLNNEVENPIDNDGIFLMVK